MNSMARGVYVRLTLGVGLFVGSLVTTALHMLVVPLLI